MRKIFHLEYKKRAKNKHFFSTTLVGICENNEMGVSKATLDRWDFSKPYENDHVILTKVNLLQHKSTKPKKI